MFSTQECGCGQVYLSIKGTALFWLVESSISLIILACLMTLSAHVRRSNIRPAVGSLAVAAVSVSLFGRRPYRARSVFLSAQYSSAETHYICL
jgi:hypothetical protein